jgi:hypothetical protein
MKLDIGFTAPEPLATTCETITMLNTNKEGVYNYSDFAKKNLNSREPTSKLLAGVGLGLAS